MIALPAQMPLLQIGSQQVIHYEQQWLQDAITKAACEAGHEKWWFAEDVAKGMILYLQKRFCRNTITLQELFDKMARTLQTIGFTDVADKLEPTPPPMRISLLELTREAGSGYELLFFDLLGRRLAELRRLGARDIQCSEIRDCVKSLRQTSRWDRNCDLLLAEIVDFVQGNIDISAPAHEQFSLMVR